MVEVTRISFLPGWFVLRGDSNVTLTETENLEDEVETVVVGYMDTR